RGNLSLPHAQPRARAAGGCRPRASGSLRAADSGKQITRAFCPDCGTMLFLRVSARPDLVAIRVGTLDDPSGVPPEADIFVKSAQPWDYMTPELPKYPTYPPGQAYKPGAGEGRT